MRVELRNSVVEIQGFTSALTAVYRKWEQSGRMVWRCSARGSGAAYLARPAGLDTRGDVLRSAMHPASNKSGDGMPSRGTSAFLALCHLPSPSVLQGIRLP